MVSIVIVIALVLLALHVYGAAFASWHLSKSPYFEPYQKYMQLAIIWLVPILGTAFILNILGPEVRQRRPGWIPWLDFMLVSAFASSATAAIETAEKQDDFTATESSATGDSDD